MKSSARYVLTMLLGVFLGIALVLEFTVLAERESGKSALTPLPLDEVRGFSEVYARIKSDYVEEVADKKLLSDAIQGMLSGLDPHSSYLDAESFKELRVETQGQFGGLGIEVTLENGFVKVVAPIEDTPAARAGIKTGDLIVRLDDTAVKGLTLGEAVRLMRGKPGSDITLTVLRSGASKPLKITLTRAVIKIQSVKQRVLEPGYGYLRITQFQEGTNRGVREALRKLETENKGELKGLILDLRNNPGGVLNDAVEVSDVFLEKGMIVYTQGRTADSKQQFHAKPGDLLHGAPVAVLVNGGSASASEIVAGALQDHKRAVVIGTKTFGKGSVQTIMPLSNSTAVKITTARYYTPLGRSIQASGIVPDIVAEEARVTKAEAGERLREADLARHLENENGTPDTETPDAAPKKDGADKDKKTDAPAKDAEDYQLNEALNLLKGIALFQNRGT